MTFDTQSITETAAANNEYVTLKDYELDNLMMTVEAAESALLRLRQEDRGWDPLTGDLAEQVSHDELVQNANKVRAFSRMNPLLKRGKIVRAGYVFGDGITITARSDGKERRTQNVSAVIDDLTKDNRNLAAVFSTNAQHSIEHDLFDDGNVFLGHWVNPLTGKVQIRQISFEEITSIRTRSGDALVPQFYLRQWTSTNAAGKPVTLKAWYPDLRHHPAARDKSIDGIPVLWPGKTYGTLGTGAAIYHHKVNPIGRNRVWGIGDGYAAMPWARSYTSFMTDWAGLMNALSKIAYHMRSTGNREQLARTAAQTQYGQAGGTTYGTFELEAPNIRGASFDADSGRPLAALVAAALGLSVTILTADPGSTGARAVAETLDTPQRNEMKARQRLHVSYYRAVCDFAIQQAVVAPRGALNATVLYQDEQRIVEFRDKTDPSVDVRMPNLDNVDTTALVDAVAKADATGKLPPVETLKLLLNAFGYDDLANIVDANTDDNGNWVDPYANVATSAGSAAANILRRGGDPTGIL